MQLNEIIEAKLKLMPTEPLIWRQSVWWSRAAFLQLVEECTRVLRMSGLKRGQRLALILPNSPAFLAYMIAAWELGAAIVPTDPKSGYETLVHQIDHADVFAAITYSGCSHIAPLICEDGIPCVVSPLDEPCEVFDGRTCAIEDDGTAVIFYTPGIASEAKAVPLTHDNIIAGINAAHSRFSDVDEDDVFLNALPDFNALGLICGALIPLCIGAKQTILNGFMPTDKALKAMRLSGVTFVPAVPMMIALMANAIGHGAVFPSSVRNIIVGGDKFSSSLRAKCERLFPVPVYEGYGLTETSSVVACPIIEKGVKPGVIGPLMDGVEAQIRGDDGTVLPAGDEGRLWLHGACVTNRYYGNPELTEKRFIGGWFDTEDIAVFDEDGNMKIVSRSSDVIFVGGYKVYCRKVERALLSHPAVASAAVVGIPRALSGEIVKAFVVLKKDAKTSQKELMEYCRSKLAYYQVPRIIDFIPAMPRTETGEILKRKLVANDLM